MKIRLFTLWITRIHLKSWLIIHEQIFPVSPHPKQREPHKLVGPVVSEVPRRIWVQSIVFDFDSTKQLYMTQGTESFSLKKDSLMQEENTHNRESVLFRELHRFGGMHGTETSFSTWAFTNKGLILGLTCFRLNSGRPTICRNSMQSKIFRAAGLWRWMGFMETVW